MRNLIRLALLGAVGLGSLSAATVSYSVTNLNTNNGNGQPLYRYVYNLIGVPLQLNQELDIRFEVTRYAAISMGVSPGLPNFDLVLFPVNNPINADGRYSLLSLVNNPSMIGTFSVDFAWIGAGQPGAQTFFVNQLDAQGGFVSRLASGFTSTSGGSSSGGDVIPEPSTIILSAAGIAAVVLARRRR